MGMYVAIVVGLPLRIHPSFRPIDMRFDIGKRVVARVERRGSLCDSTEHVGILQGLPKFFPSSRRIPDPTVRRRKNGTPCPSHKHH